MGWRKVVLSGEHRASGQSLEVDFELAFIAAGVPETAALFIERGDTADIYYFSPQASRIFRRELDALQATACPPPADPDLVVAVGVPKARTLLQVS